MKKNCWEVMGCGREPGGIHTEKLGVCPAAIETRLDGVHGGKNAGRACWAVAGTFCDGDVQGTFARKFGDCLKCPFFNQVIKEEYPRFITAAELVKMLRDRPKK